MTNKTKGLVTLLFLSLFIQLGCTNSSSVGNVPKGSVNEGVRSYKKGVEDANDAVARDCLQLKEYPPIPYPPGYNVYTQLLRERCGVTFDVIEQPPIGVSHDIFREEISGWNTTMEAEITRRFGNDIFKKLSSEAGLVR
ncbi:MAG: hypothetical protein RLY14_2531 [Planctomycetota bacterium]|jgi:hypothetical protein